jgi:hypothetical protein
MRAVTHATIDDLRTGDFATGKYEPLTAPPFLYVLAHVTGNEASVELVVRDGTVECSVLPS